jgi:hypothetical protein
MTSAEPGNALTRGAEEFYESEILQAEIDVHSAQGKIEAEVPAKTWVTLKLRAATSKELLDKTPWCAPEQFTCRKGDFMQYQLVLGAINSLRTPRISEVVIELNGQ